MFLLYTWYDAYYYMLFSYLVQCSYISLNVLSRFIFPVMSIVLTFAIVVSLTENFKFLLVTYSTDPVLQAQSKHQSLYARTCKC